MKGTPYLEEGDRGDDADRHASRGLQEGVREASVHLLAQLVEAVVAASELDHRMPLSPTRAHHTLVPAWPVDDTAEKETK